MSATVTKSRQSVYTIVTEQILAALEKGVVPWRRPWGGKQLMPKSATTGNRYRGINVWLLYAAAEIHEYESDCWTTYRQAQALGGQVRKGEKSTIVTFWTTWTPKDSVTEDNEDGKKLPVLKYFRVFNAEQCDGLGEKFTKRPDVPTYEHDPITACEAIVAGYQNGPAIEHGGFRAVYQPGADRVVMPRPEVFETRQAYSATLFHELAHSTGHKNRLNRESLGTQDVKVYGKEELIAEMASALLCGVAGISPATIENSAAYLAGWCKAIREDTKLVIRSAAAGQRAADCILGTTPEGD